MSNKQIFLLIGGILCITLGLLLFSVLAAPPKVGKGQVDENRCPDCGRELPKRSLGECPFCKMLKGPEKKGGKGSAPRRFTATDFVVLGCILFLTIGGGYLILRSMNLRLWFYREKPSFYYRCPKCKRRIRYFARLAGRNALCPACSYAIVLPDPNKPDPRKRVS
jgi:hypothetical protein